MANFTSLIENIHNRAIIKSEGNRESDLNKPIIGIVYALGGVGGAQYTTQSTLENVKRGVIEQGGLPLLLPVLGVNAAFTLGNEGSKYLMPAREIAADSVQVLVCTHLLDGVVLISDNSTIMCGLLMGAARANVPCISLSLSAPQFSDSIAETIPSLLEAAGAVRGGKKNVAELSALDNNLSFEREVDVFDCVLEALNAPTGNGTLPLGMKRLEQQRHCGQLIVALCERHTPIKMLLNEAAFLNAINLALALGASGSVFVNLIALAFEFNIDLSFDKLRSAAAKISAVVDLKNLNRESDGMIVSSVLKHLEERKLIDSSTQTIYGRELKEIISSAHTLLPTNMSALAILEGNLADSALCKRPANYDETFVGKARVFNNEEDALFALSSNSISKGDAVVLRYQGAKSAALPDAARVAAALVGAGLLGGVALITDGACNANYAMPIASHLVPEASEGGNLSLVENGDRIIIDFSKGKLTLDIGAKELASRRKKWKPQAPTNSGLLLRYSALVSPADKGAVLKTKF